MTIFGYVVRKKRPHFTTVPPQKPLLKTIYLLVEKPKLIFNCFMTIIGVEVLGNEAQPRLLIFDPSHSK